MLFSGLCTQYFKEQVYNKMFMWGPVCTKTCFLSPLLHIEMVSRPSGDWWRNKSVLFIREKMVSGCVHLPQKWGDIEDVRWGLGSVNTDLIMYKSTSSHCAQLGEPQDGGKADGSSQVLLLFLTGIQGQTLDWVTVCNFWFLHHFFSQILELLGEEFSEIVMPY